MKVVHFLDLGIACGQSKSGLERSGELAWQHLHQTYNITKFYRLKGKCRSEYSPFFKSDEIDLPLSLYQSCYRSALSSLKSASLSLFWGGDHSLSISTVQAFLDIYPNGKIIWIDAHADMNIPESSPSGNFHGMPVAYLLGLKPSPIRTKNSQILDKKQICYLGLRSLDPFESQFLSNSDLIHYHDSVIRDQGISHVCMEISRWVGDDPLHISFDVDVIDPEIASSTGVPVPGGLTIKEIQIMASYFSKIPHLKSFDIVEINPELGDEANVWETYQAAYQFLDPFLQSSRRFYDSNASDFKRKYSNAPSGHFSFPAPDPF